MSATLAIPPDLTADAARVWLTQAGWNEVGTGDWSWTFADGAALAARVTPIDPAYRLHAQACLDGPANRWLPRVHALLPLRREGYVTVMERLHPAPEAAAEAFCAALGITNQSGYDVRAAGEGALHDGDGQLADLRRRITGLIEEGARRYALWGGSDIRPGNVMATADGQLKLVDPLFFRGPAIVAAIRDRDCEALRGFSRVQLEDFLTIPVFSPGPETEALRRGIAALYD